jgi:hypothetical protein
MLYTVLMIEETKGAEMQNTIQARSEQVDARYAPHGCYDGWAYIGHLVIDEDGEEVECIEAVRCHRCAISEHHERF